MRNRRGVTLIEMLIAITVFSIVMASTLGFLSKQGKGLDRNSTDMGMLQNLTFAGSLLEQEIRLAGANVPFKQPGVVYAGANAVVFNADYASNVDSLYAVYFNPGLPAGQVNALTPTNRIALPGTSPLYSYPDSLYYASGVSAIISPAETIDWYFTLDTSTVNSTDYVLMRQVNNAAPEVVIRNVIPTTGRNFFRYYYKRVPSSGTAASSLDTVPTNWMPVIHTQGVHGSVNDINAAARADSLAMVEVSFTVTNALTGADLRSRSISFMVPLPNLAVKKVTSCGDAPILGSSLNPNWVVSGPGGIDTTMVLTWNRAVDDVGGESDVRAYIIWRRPIGMATWPDPIATVAAGATSPSYADETAVQGPPGYQYGLAAQDCTPSLSGMVSVTAPLTP